MIKSFARWLYAREYRDEIETMKRYRDNVATHSPAQRLGAIDALSVLELL